MESPIQAMFWCPGVFETKHAVCVCVCFLQCCVLSHLLHRPIGSSRYVLSVFPAALTWFIPPQSFSLSENTHLNVSRWPVCVCVCERRPFISISITDSVKESVSCSNLCSAHTPQTPEPTWLIPCRLWFVKTSVRVHSRCCLSRGWFIARIQTHFKKFMHKPETKRWCVRCHVKTLKI